MSPSLHQVPDSRPEEEEQLERVVEEISLLRDDPSKPTVESGLTSECGDDLQPRHGKGATGKELDRWPGFWLQRLSQSYFDNYVLLVMTASVGVAMSSTFTKVATAEMPVFQFTLIRSFVCTAIAVALSLWNEISLFQPRSKVRWYLMRGITGSGAFLCLVFTICKLRLSEAAFLTNSYPAVTAALSWLLGMEQLGVLTWVGVAGCLAGNALVAHPPFLYGGHANWGPDRLLGIGCAVGANLLLAVTFLIIKYMGKGTSPIVLTAYMHGVSFFLSIPFVVAGYPLRLTFKVSWPVWLCLVGSSLIGVPNQLVLARGLQIGPPSKTNSIYMTNMFVAALMGAIVLHERLSWIAILGAIVVLSSVILITTQRTTEKESSYEPVQTVEESEHIEMTVQDRS